MASEGFKKYLTGQNVVVGAILFIIIILVTLIAVKFKVKDEATPIKEGQIMIKKGDEVLIVNRNGLIEYRTKDGTFFQSWDQDKVSDLFALLEKKAREYLDNPTGPCGGCFEVTLFIDGKIITIYVKGDDKDLNKIMDEVKNPYDDVSISEIFAQNPTGTSQTTPTPAGGSGGGNPTPTPNLIIGDGDDYSPQDNYPPVEANCSSWSQDIVSKAIISNTLCTVQD